MLKNLIVMGLIFNMGTAFSAGDPKAGEKKALTVCLACHGKDGKSVNPIYPNLKGQNVQYLEKQIKDFRAGKRTNDNGIMKAMVGTLTDQEIADVAAFYSSQK